ncbi:PRD domain-containing protein [Collinsella intestinalis]|uniref:PRD domain-containing protein n=1 Tax=Collinsella intestinalis TaxID=147207 RepID=UPI001958BF21|nr:PRD domain-containing protein [Collinsella intestinalis]
MRAIQRINHNAAICEDGAGHQLIALGCGIGFGDMPHEVNLEDVKRTFYAIDRKYLAFIDEVDPDVLEFSAQLADIVTQQVSYELSPNLPITLADHIQFALKRARDHLVVPMPLAEDVEQAHPVEYRLAQMAVRGMQKTFGVRVDRHEAGAWRSARSCASKSAMRRVPTSAMRFPAFLAA